MADYPPPQESNPIWNPANFLYGSSNLTIDTANSLYIKKTGADTAVGPLTIKNDLTVQGEMYASAGLVSAPSYSFTSETNSGLYRNAAGDLRISILGADSLGITAGIVNIYDYVRGGHGSQVAPIYSFRGNSDTGVYSLGAGSGGIGFSTGTDLCCYMQYKRSYFGDGTGAALPSISFINETNTGLYRAGVNDLRISVNGVDRIQQNTSATQINQPILLKDLYIMLDKVEGVQTVPNIEIINKEGIGYSNYAYDIQGATLKDVVYPSLDPMCFELKNTNDIKGRVVPL